MFRIKNLDKIPRCKPTPELATELAKKATKQKKSKSKLQQEFSSEIIRCKSKARVTRCELRFQINEFRVQIYELRVQISELDD